MIGQYGKADLDDANGHHDTGAYPDSDDATVSNNPRQAKQLKFARCPKCDRLLLNSYQICCKEENNG